MTFDQIDRMVRGANPVPDPNALQPVAAPVLVASESWSVNMQTQERTENRSGGVRPRSRGLIAVGAAVVAVCALTAVFVFNASEDAEDPAETATTVTTAVTTTVAQAVVPPGAVPPLGVEIVGIDGSTSNLGLPKDAWMANLSPDGQRIVFLTTSIDVGFCGGCQPGGPVRMAIVPVGSTRGGYVYFAEIDFASVAHPAWSPDGTQIAFQGTRLGNSDIYVADLSGAETPTDGSYLAVPTTRLTSDPGVDQFPSWSPDGTIVFYDNLGTGVVDFGMSDTGEIWSVPVAGGDPTRLTNDDLPDMQPDVSSDGTVAYWSGGEIWVMAMDGSGARRLESIPADLGWHPRWSPDGTEIALLQYNPNAPRAIFGGPKRPAPLWGTGPGSLPIHATNLPPMNVVVVNVESGESTTLDVQVASFYNPVSWMPDGTALLVNRYR
jgi:Tol biopolymer transport system component